MKLRNESGRSMIEMTAVISIIGILSIASFFGYRTAMVRIRTNTLLSEANRRAVSISSQLNQAQIPTLAEFKNNTISGGIEFDTEINTNSYDGQFGIKVSNVSYKICNNLLDATKQSNSPLRAIASEDAPHVALTECPKGEGENAENEEHNYMLIYNNDLATTAYVQTCSQPLIEITMCDKVTKQKCCPDNGNMCQDQVNCCNTDANCPHSEICQNNACICPEEDHFRDKDGNCVSCSDLNTKVVSDSAECRKCPLRAWNTNKNCQLCGEGKFVYRNPTLTSSDGCYSCATTTAYVSTPESCTTCPSRSYVKNDLGTTVCQKSSCASGQDPGFRAKDGACYVCNTSNSPQATQAECESCKDAQGNLIRAYGSRAGTNFYCPLATCNGFRNYRGACVACKDDTISNSSGALNRVYGPSGTNEFNNEVCTTKCSSGSDARILVRQDAMYFYRLQSLKSDSAGHQSGKYHVFTNKNGDTVDCTTKTTSDYDTTKRTEVEIDSTTTNWGKCNERLIKNNGSKYYYSKLESESYFMNKDGRNVACNITLTGTNANIIITADDANSAKAKCDDVCTATGQKRKAYQSGSTWYCRPNN